MPNLTRIHAGESVTAPAAQATPLRAPRRIKAVWCERQRDRSPLDVFHLLTARGLSAHGGCPAFLYSGDASAPGGRYSLIALEPDAVLRVPPESASDPFAELRDALSLSTWSGANRPPVPFIGGWLGYFSYDLAHRIERLRTAARRDHGFPLVELAFYRCVLAYDHEARTWTACRLLDENAPEDPARAALDDLLDELMDAPTPARNPSPALAGPLTSNFTHDQYETAVRRALDYIAAGDTYQVNVSQRFEGRLAIPPDELALRLFEASPAPFSAFLSFDDRAIVSASPERFLRIRGGVVETWPIKGTRPRGATPDDDARLRAELLASEKERAELVMITDLLRNDLGRVCDYGTVRVAELRAVASYRNVHHTYSRITGRLRRQTDLVDLLRATLPGGSVTGAPKVRAMEIIEELEPTARGPYCGAIGYIGVDGAMDLNVAIRTMLVEDDKLTFQVGGGIVADSRPADEYAETLHKARGILTALGAALPETQKVLA